MCCAWSFLSIYSHHIKLELSDSYVPYVCNIIKFIYVYMFNKKFNDHRINSNYLNHFWF